MGYMRHHAIVVTSWSRERLELAHAEAVRLGCQVSAVTEPATNGYSSFFVAPDGSKEGWGDSDAGDVRRAALIEWLRAWYVDGYLDWAEVIYGDDNREARLSAASDLDAAANALDDS